MDWPVRWTKSGYRYVCLERVAWVDFRPCYRCTLPASACAQCDQKVQYQQRKQRSLERQRKGADAKGNFPAWVAPMAWPAPARDLRAGSAGCVAGAEPERLSSSASEAPDEVDDRPQSIDSLESS